jgi:phosphoribosyl 1,2-cyclic phosphate phosphodiesterase
VRRIDAIVFTHAHADHLMGLDEVRRYNMLAKQPMPVFGDAATLREVRRTFAYIFASDAPAGGGVPDVRLFPIAGEFCLGRQTIQPIPIRHGHWNILGFRFGRFAYLTDCNGIQTRPWRCWRGLDCLVLDALRRRPHPTHFTIDEAVQMATRIGATAYLHAHRPRFAPRGDVRAAAAGMALAHDGLLVEVADGRPLFSGLAAAGAGPRRSRHSATSMAYRGRRL